MRTDKFDYEITAWSTTEAQTIAPKTTLKRRLDSIRVTCLSCETVWDYQVQRGVGLNKPQVMCPECNAQERLPNGL